MARTIKDKPAPIPTAHEGEALPPVGGKLQGFLDDLNSNQKMELVNNATNVIQEGLRTFNAAEQRRGMEAQYRRDIRLSDNEVEKARLDRDQFVEHCRVELARIESQVEDTRANNAYKAEQARHFQQLARACWDHYVETGDTASLHAMMQQAMLAANKA